MLPGDHCIPPGCFSCLFLLGSLLIGKAFKESNMFTRRVNQLVEAGLSAEYWCSSDLEHHDEFIRKRHGGSEQFSKCCQILLAWGAGQLILYCYRWLRSNGCFGELKVKQWVALIFQSLQLPQASQFIAVPLGDPLLHGLHGHLWATCLLFFFYFSIFDFKIISQLPILK